MSTTQHIRRLVIDLDPDDVERLKTWEPCTRIRLVPVDDGAARLEIDTRAVCRTCKGAGTWDGHGFKARCKDCAGTGLR